MHSESPVCRAIVAAALFMICLPGCGGKSTTDDLVSTTATTAETIPTIQTTTMVPAAPTGIIATGGTNKVTISWNAVTSATSYTIYWTTAAGVVADAGTSLPSASNTYIHRGLAPSITCNYIVTARNSFGESSASEQVSAVTAALDGAYPYAIYCASCHGSLATSRITDTDTAAINAAMQSISDMRTITVSATQIAAISSALMYNK